MSSKIKGITLEIGGDVTSLNKALGGVNKISKDLQSELKQVERLLKLDPSNTELLAQKQKILAGAISNSGEKLNLLRDAQEQVNEQFRRGDINEEQYRAFQREVVSAEQELQRFERRLEEVGRVSRNLGEDLQKTGSKMKSTGEKMTVGITAPIVAAGGMMLKGAMDAEAAQGKLQASLGLTVKEAEKLGEVAKEVWKNGFGENIDEVDQAIANVRKNMGDMADQEMQKVTEGAMTIADVFDQDVNEVTRAAGVMMKNFGISGQDAMDLITVGFQKGGDFSGELLDTLREYSPQFVSLGLSADQAMAMLIKGAEAGAWNLDKVGDAMKEFNIRAQDGSKTTAEGFAAIGLNAAEMGMSIAKGGEDAQKAFMATIAALTAMEDPMAQNQAGIALFGTQWEDVRSQVITAMADGVTGIKDFQGATADATKTLQENNPSLVLIQAFREIQGAVGPALLPIAEIINKDVAPALKSMAEGFSNLSPNGQKAIIAIAAIAAAIGPVLFVAGNLITLVGTISTALPILGAAFTALTGPIGLSVAAVATVIAIGVELYRNWDDVKSRLSSTWDGISRLFSGNGEALKRGVSSLIGDIKNIFANLRIEIPRPKLPHINVDWRSVGFGDMKIRIPDFGIDWYDKGGIFNDASIIGVGEKRKEAVTPIDELPNLIVEALKKALGIEQQKNYFQEESLQPLKIILQLDSKTIAEGLYDIQSRTFRAKGIKQYA
ncbi:phage tail tape measure protein [Bacteroides sp.]|uniref:phage tail tape measure protein n=1 Tax=Bacteroides sp. TaxID=29523 RepID=UPI00260C6F32|nr:phage tail tape measure protein [Bacteroides sp.]MDD3040774.1 phage tail tape measure protein [Bacteroides sp.]